MIYFTILHTGYGYIWRDGKRIELAWETPVNTVREALRWPELPLEQNRLSPLISEET